MKRGNKDKSNNQGYPVRSRFRHKVYQQALRELQNQVAEFRFCGFQELESVRYGLEEDYGTDLDTVQDGYWKAFQEQN